MSLMSDSLRREVVDGGDKWSVEGIVEADSVSTNIVRFCAERRRERPKLEFDGDESLNSMATKI